MNTDRLTAARWALRARSATAILVLPLTCVIALSLISSELHALRGRRNAAPAPFDEVISERAEDLFRQGARIFREDTEGRLLSRRRFATLTAVVQHYNRVFNLRLSDSEMNELVEYLKSL